MPCKDRPAANPNACTPRCSAQRQPLHPAGNAVRMHAPVRRIEGEADLQRLDVEREPVQRHGLTQGDVEREGLLSVPLK